MVDSEAIADSFACKKYNIGHDNLSRNFEIKINITDA